MRPYLTSKRLLAKLEMLRGGKKSKTIVVVEGLTDYRMYGKLLDPMTCEIVIGESKENIIEVIRECEKEKLLGVIGIVDADFWHIDSNVKSLPKTLFMTDLHDLECMMLSSKAFEDVFLEYGDLSKLAKFERTIGMQLKQWMLENVALVGYLRKLSLDQNLELSFSQLKFEKFMNLETLEIIEERMIQEILYASHKQTRYKSWQISKWLHQEMNANDNLWQVCCGHDLMEWLAIGFKQHFGAYNAKKMTAGQLEGNFRLAYHNTLFKDTKLCRTLDMWERSQKDFYVFSHINRSREYFVHST